MIELSRVGLGTNNIGRRLDLGRARTVVDAAIDAGVTHIDTADTYGGGDSERFLGEILDGRRERVVIATKFGMAEGGNGLPEYVRRAIDATFDRLEELERLAAEQGLTLLELAIGALASQPAVVSVIAGATTPEQVRANAAAATIDAALD